MDRKDIVIDANILIRAALGNLVINTITKYAASAIFYAPDIAFADACSYLPAIFRKRGIPREQALQTLVKVSAIVQSIDFAIYGDQQHRALQRIAIRDPDDWPILACALRFDCPVWTEDTDFFGCGVPTWTTDRVELFFTE